MFRKIKEMFDESHEIIGWVGMLLILLAYGGVSTLYVSADSIGYQVVNGVGAAMLVYSTYKTRSYPVMVLNIVWFEIAILAALALV
tara:strand:+ start:9511 stop:9768 length:258 start_codon:yes stop_codon:yes gene_type:complete